MNELKVVRVQVWYEDGPRESMDWTTLPSDGVLHVTVHYANGTKYYHMGEDCYFTAEGPNDRIYGSTSNPKEIETIKDRYVNPVVLRGRWTDAITMDDILRRVASDD